MDTEQEWHDYLIRDCKLDAAVRYYFWFLDGTGIYSLPSEFGAYAVRRYKVFPEDSFEIAGPEEGYGGAISFEITPPTVEGQTLGPDCAKETRF